MSQMAATYDDAVAALYQAPHASFVAERKRLANDLKAAGDKAGATRLAKLPRPPISAWAVNQLWWHARETFASMLESAEQLREGDLGVTARHRDTVAKLRQRASTILADAGHAATEATLRRVTTTLAAIAATGGFDPDPPGALGDDRDPPGFEAIGIGMASPSVAAEPATPAPKQAHAKQTEEADAGKAEARRREAEEARERAEAERQRRMAEDEAARRRTERHRLEAALRNERGDIEAKRREVERLQKQIANLEESILQAQASIDDMEKRTAELADE